MVRRLAAALAVACCPLLFAQIDISDPAFVPRTTVGGLAGDATQLYVVTFGTLTRLDRELQRRDLDAIRLDDANGATMATGAGILVSSTWNGLAGLAPDGTQLWAHELEGRTVRDIVYDGGAFVALWTKSEYGTMTDAGIMRVDAGGTVLETRTLLRRVWSQFLSDVELAVIDGEPMLAWVEVAGAFVMRAKEGVALRVSSTAWDVDVASNGRTALVTMNAVSRLDAVLLGSKAQIVDGPHLVAQVRSIRHAVTWDGRAFRVAWQADAKTAAIGTAIVEPLHGVRAIRHLRFGALSWNADVRLVAGAGGALVVHNGRGVFAEAGEPFDSNAEPRVLNYSRANDSGPRAAWMGDRYVVVWGRGGSGTYARFFDRRGAPLGERVRLETGAHPAMISATSHTLLAIWDEAGGIFGRRFDREGNPIDEAPFALPAANVPGGDRPVAAANDGRRFLIATTAGCTLTLHDLGEREPFRPDAGVAVQMCDLRTPDMYGLGGIALAFDGSEYGLLFHIGIWPGCSCNNPIPTQYPYLMRVTAAGFSKRAIPLGDPAPAGSLAAGGGNFIVELWGKAMAIVSNGLGRKSVIPTAGFPDSRTFWNGAAFVSVSGDGDGYAVRDRDGALISHHPDPWLMEAGAGDGSGGMMLVYRDPERLGVLMALFEPSRARPRAVRK